jgi:hypothetical protein
MAAVDLERKAQFVVAHGPAKIEHIIRWQRQAQQALESEVGVDDVSRAHMIPVNRPCRRDAKAARLKGLGAVISMSLDLAGLLLASHQLIHPWHVPARATREAGEVCLDVGARDFCARFKIRLGVPVGG